MLPQNPNHDKSEAALKAFIEEVGWQNVPVGKAAVERQRQEQEARLAAMLAWLDQQAAGQ